VYQAAYPKPPTTPNFAPNTEALRMDLEKIQEMKEEKARSVKDCAPVGAMSPTKKVVGDVANGAKKRSAPE